MGQWWLLFVALRVCTWVLSVVEVGFHMLTKVVRGLPYTYTVFYYSSDVKVVYTICMF